jgi:hypothetical protein
LASNELSISSEREEKKSKFVNFSISSTETIKFFSGKEEPELLNKNPIILGFEPSLKIIL